MKKVLGIIMTVLMSAVLLSGCSGSDSKQPNAGEAKVIRLAHNLNEQHTVHQAIEKFAKQVEEKTNGKVKVQIFPNGQLGSEDEVMEQLTAGAIPVTKVSAASLAKYDTAYNVFGLPFVFKDKDHYQKAMKSEAVQNMYTATKDKGFIALTYYTSGARSFYTTKKPILSIDDLKGQKIRIQPMEAQTDMMKALGGTPVTMPYGDVYTGLQSGVIDGAENNETALTVGKHGEVAKHFSLTEQTMIPDILVISSKTWESFTPEEQKIIKQAAVDSTEFHTSIWDKAIADAVKEAQEKMNVQFHKVDKAPFQKAVQPMLDQYKNKYPEVKKLLDAFAAIQ